MNENLNLVEILKYVLKGTKLWSPICGECTFLYIDDNDFNYPINCLTADNYGKKDVIKFTKYGAYISYYENGECVLFPSKENHDWPTFKVPKKHKHFEPFQRVLAKCYVTSGEYIWCCALYSHYDESTGRHYFVNFGFTTKDDNIIPYEGNEDKVGKIAES